MLPLGGLFISLFAAWAMSRADAADELAMGEGIGFRVWRLLVCYLTPVAVTIVFFNVTGLLDVLVGFLGY